MTLLALLSWPLVSCIQAPKANDRPPVALGGQAALSVDHWRGTASLRVQTFVPTLSQLPEDRQGLALGECAKIAPRSVADSMIYAPRVVQARCEGYTLTQAPSSPGVHAWALSPMPKAGTVCTIAVDGVSVDLPALAAWSKPELSGRTLTWTAADANEVRVVTLGDGESTICRLPDTGRAKLKRGMGRGTTFVTWHNAAYQKVGERPMSLSATVGTWLE